MMGKLICSFLAGMEINFIKERKTCCTESVIAVATGTLYMLEKEKEMLSQFSRKEESINHFVNFFFFTNP